MRYGLFGCGNKDWTTTYQAIPKDIAAHMERAGAQALLERGEGDRLDEIESEVAQVLRDADK